MTFRMRPACLMAALIGGISLGSILSACAQTTNLTNHLIRVPVFKVRRVGEFIGTLTAVDAKGQTVSIASGKPDKVDPQNATLYVVTTNTSIFKGQTPAALQDAVVGQEIRYGLRLARNGGTNELVLLRFLSESAPAADAK